MSQEATPLPLKDLLAELAWIRSLARALLFDGTEVDDAVQQTWLLALQGGSRPPVRPRAWLAGILRNVVRRRARSEVRRRRHERAASASGAAPSALDLVAQTELHRVVVGAVLALREPYRSTILLHYFRGWSPRDIAAHEGLADATIRSRLHRGLELLRGRLDVVLGRERRRWSLALVPLAVPLTWDEVAAATTGAGASSSASSFLGALMAVKTKVVAAALVSAVALGAWWILDEGAAPRRDASVHDGGELGAVPSAPSLAGVPAAAPEPLAVSVPPDNGALAGAAVVEDADGPGEPAHFTGRVVDERAAPLAGARVLFVPNSHSLLARGIPVDWHVQRLPELDLAEAHTDAEGRFSLHARHVSYAFGEGPRSSFINPLLFPEVIAEAPGRGRAALVLRGYDGGDRALGDLVLGPGGVVTGRVVDEDGRPIAGVDVDGRFWLDGEMATASDDVGQKGHASAFLDARTGDDGRFALTGTTSGSGALELRHPDYLVEETDGFLSPVGETLDLGNFVLRAGGSVAGRVVDPSGAPVAGAFVMAHAVGLPFYDMGTDTILLGVRGMSEWPGTPRTDAAGGFLLRALPEGSVTVWVDAPGFEPLRRDAVRVGTRDLLLGVVPQGTLRVRVVDAVSRAPVEAAAVRAWRVTGDPTREPVELGVRAEPDVVGVFVVERPGIVATRLSVAAPGYAVAVGDAPGVLPPGTLEHEVRLLPESVLAGRVTDAAGVPVAGAQLTLTGGGPRPEPEKLGLRRGEERVASVADDPARIVRETVSDDEGRFRFAGLAAGLWRLDARARGFAGADAGELSLGEGERREDHLLVLAPGGTLRGTLWDVDGNLAAGEGIAIWRRGADGELGEHRGAVGDEQGRFVVECLRPGSYHLQSDPGALLDFEVVAGETTEIDVRQRRKPRVSGRAFDVATGEPIAGAQVALLTWYESDGERFQGSGNVVHADSEGRFVLDDGWVGDHDLVAYTSGGATSLGIPLRLEWGDDVVLDVPFASGRISGRLVASDGTPVVNGRVSLAQTYRGGPAWSDPEGRFEIAHLAPGDYELAYGALELVALDDVRVTLGGAEAVEGLLLRLGKAAALEGEVLHANGVPIADGTYVELLTDGSDHGARAETQGGRFAFDTVRPGRYELVVGNLAQAQFFQNDAWIHWREPLTLAAGERRTLRIALER